MSLFLGVFLLFFGNSSFAGNIHIIPDPTLAENQKFINELASDMKQLNRRKVKAHFLSMDHRNLRKEDYLFLIETASAPNIPPCFINSLVSQMSDTFPEYRINEYILSSGAFTGKGLQLILDFHAPLLPHKVQYHIVNSLKALKQRLDVALADDQSHGIFYQKLNDAHFSLIYINKKLKAEHCTVQILDAAITTQGAVLSSKVQKMIPSHCIIAVEEDRRHCDRFSCSVFAATDFFQLSALDDAPLQTYPSGYDHQMQVVKVAPELMVLAQPHAAINHILATASNHPGISKIKAMIRSTLITLPKQNEEKEVTDAFCADDLDQYFNTKKDQRRNVGAKLVHDRYVNAIIKHLVFTKSHQNSR